MPNVSPRTEQAEAVFPVLARHPNDATTFGLDDWRRGQLVRADDYGLKSTVAWGLRNARLSDETIFAANCLANRAVPA